MPETNGNITLNGGEVLTIQERGDKIKQLKNLLKDVDVLKGLRTDDEYLERFLYGTEFDVEKAFDRMKTYYELLLEYPEWYRKVAPLEKKNLLEKDIRIIIPQYDKEGRPIYIVKLGNIDVSKMDLLDVVALDDIWLEFVLLNKPEYAGKGLCVIIDIHNYSWKMLKWVTPDIVRNCVKKLQTMPYKDYRFHLVNKSYLINTAIKIILPFLPQYIKDMIKFHFDNWDSLYEHVDREVLPPEYGGDTPVHYSDIYEDLFRKNDQILESFMLYRTLDKQ